MPATEVVKEITEVEEAEFNKVDQDTMMEVKLEEMIFSEPEKAPMPFPSAMDQRKANRTKMAAEEEDCLMTTKADETEEAAAAPPTSKGDLVRTILD